MAVVLYVATHGDGIVANKDVNGSSGTIELNQACDRKQSGFDIVAIFSFLSFFFVIAGKIIVNLFVFC